MQICGVYSGIVGCCQSSADEWESGVLGFQVREKWHNDCKGRTLSADSIPKHRKTGIFRGSFDEVHFIGLEAFPQMRNSCWDVPLNENLHQPVINLPVPAITPDEAPIPTPASLSISAHPPALIADPKSLTGGEYCYVPHFVVNDHPTELKSAP